MDERPFEPEDAPNWETEDDAYFAQMKRVVNTVAQFRIFLAQAGMEKGIATSLTERYFDFLLDSGELG